MKTKGLHGMTIHGKNSLVRYKLRTSGEYKEKLALLRNLRYVHASLTKGNIDKNVQTAFKRILKF